MKNALENLKYNACIFIFGITEWTDIVNLSEIISECNEIVVVEPDLYVYNQYKNEQLHNVHLIYFDERNKYYLEKKIIEVLNIYNYKNTVIGNSVGFNIKYEAIFNKFNEIIVNYIYKLNIAQNTIESFQKDNVRNFIYYARSLKESSYLDNYKDINVNVPAIIVSAGPSLDINIKEMIKYKKKLKNFFIIAGNRTIEPLIKNDIIPDILVTIDSGSIADDMICNCHSVEVPLVFYERSNWKTIKNYRGIKIAGSEQFLQTICGMKDIKSIAIAGSVAHTSVDIAAYLGCSSVIFIGQDFGYTFDKCFAENSKFYSSNKVENEDIIFLKDVHGRDIKSNGLFKVYKENMELLIRKLSNSRNINFINCSYGVHIEGTEFKELKDVLNMPSKRSKKDIQEKEKININYSSVVNNLFTYINDFINLCNKYILMIRQYELSSAEIDNMTYSINEKMAESEGLWLKDYFDIFILKYNSTYFDMTISEYKEFKNSLYKQNNIYLEVLLLLKKTLMEAYDKYNSIYKEL